MTNNSFYFAKVLSVIDDNAGLRIKVKLPYEDADCKTIDELPYVFPLLPKLLHVNPKVNEMVIVFIQNNDTPKSNRFFLGPIISQPYFNNFDPYDFSARSLLEGKQIDKPLPKPELYPENNGTLPKREDIAILGRKNSDITLHEDGLTLRTGFKKEPNAESINTLHFNNIDPTYIQMRYRNYKDSNNNDYRSVLNIVADRINLLSHDSKDVYNLTDTNEMITDEEIMKIVNTAHPLIYGDLLVAFLRKLIDIFNRHTHPFPLDPPCLTQPDTTTLSTDLTNFLSNSIKIN